MPELRTVITLAAAIALVAPGVRADAVDDCASAAERAQPLRREGKLREARHQLEVCVRDVCPRLVRRDCRKWMADVKTGLASIVVRPKDPAGKALGDVELSIDGETVHGSLDGAPIELDPGEHVLRLERTGSQPVEQKVSLRHGEREHEVAVVLEPAATTVAPTTTSTPTAASSSTSTPTSTTDSTSTLGGPEARPAKRGIPVATWILGGAGLAAIGAGVYFWVSGLGDRSDLYAGCGQTHSCAQSDIDASHTKLLIGDVAIGAGIVALGVATYFTLAPRRAPSTKAALVGLAPTAGGGFVSLRAPF